MTVPVDGTDAPYAEPWNSVRVEPSEVKTSPAALASAGRPVPLTVAQETYADDKS
jgi:hypothetical protein